MMEVKIIACVCSILFMWSFWDFRQFCVTGQSFLNPLDALFLAIATFFLTAVSLLSILDQRDGSK